VPNPLGHVREGYGEKFELPISWFKAMHVAIYTPVVSNVDDRRLRIERPSSMFDLRSSILDLLSSPPSTGARDEI
jgi:hypothetical protein